VGTPGRRPNAAPQNRRHERFIDAVLTPSADKERNIRRRWGPSKFLNHTKTSVRSIHLIQATAWKNSELVGPASARVDALRRIASKKAVPRPHRNVAPPSRLMPSHPHCGPGAWQARRTRADKQTRCRRPSPPPNAMSGSRKRFSRLESSSELAPTSRCSCEPSWQTQSNLRRTRTIRAHRANAQCRICKQTFPGCWLPHARGHPTHLPERRHKNHKSPLQPAPPAPQPTPPASGAAAKKHWGEGRECPESAVGPGQ